MGLQEELGRLGAPLVIRVADAVAELETRVAAHGVARLMSQEETSNAWSYARDRRVAARARLRGLQWEELPQFGVMRHLPVLARLFTAYEPGILYPQVQMQSGTTGMNTIGNYNPIKQGRDQGPVGAFTRRCCPGLADIADEHLQEPWKAQNAGAVLGRRYP